jgi:uncharacterized membrane protein HdeD (DUF308 family)
MPSYGPPWKMAIIGAVAVVAGCALLMRDWPLAELTLFVAMVFVARGALHLVTMTFEGVSGALAALRGYSEVGIGVVLLVWPHPTLLVLGIVVGAFVVVRSTVAATVELATRGDLPYWQLHFASDVIEIALGVAIIARPDGSVHGTTVTLAVLGIFTGVVEIAWAAAQKRAETQQHKTTNVRAAAATS